MKKRKAPTIPPGTRRTISAEKTPADAIEFFLFILDISDAAEKVRASGEQRSAAAGALIWHEAKRLQRERKAASDGATGGAARARAAMEDDADLEAAARERLAERPDLTSRALAEWLHDRSQDERNVHDLAVKIGKLRRTGKLPPRVK